jgi:hypothetical protein
MAVPVVLEDGYDGSLGTLYLEFDEYGQSTFLIEIEDFFELDFFTKSDIQPHCDSLN